MLDKYMCTDTCPCRHDAAHDPKRAYEWLPESLLNKHGRTHAKESFILENNPGYYYKSSRMEPLVWAADTDQIGFNSFMECYQWYERIAERDDNIDLMLIFRFDESELGHHVGNLFKGPDHSDDFQRGRAPNEKLPKDPSGLYLYTHEDDYEVYQIFEDDFNCSGMCRQGLFYFENPITYGPPDKTCLLHLKQSLSE